ncbi:MAG: imidazole glycerol phosphate synthase subunit HisH [Candidatus Omnitrophica bacterium]|nr:imidazole glycerol phosphate synthase subunit HisH [Candidatus Omnitrophota bacterium]
MIVVVDYGMGNLKSVANACRLLGKPAIVTDSKEVIAKAEKIIFPGVGHFAQAMKELKKRGLISVIKKKIAEGAPFFGICLGMQILFEESQEAPGLKGLGVIKGKVKKFKDKSLRIPHMGWNQINIKKPTMFKGVKDRSFLYFVHSYYCEPKDKKIVATTTDYGVEFVSSISVENIWAVQFHAEKSQRLGLKLFDNFLKQ